MSKTSERQAQQDCVLCGVVFFGNPLNQHAETYLQPSGRRDWICQACRRVRMRLDVAMRRNALTWHSSLEGEICGRCNGLVGRWEISHQKYRWVTGGYDWEFHCIKCYREYHSQRWAYSCDTELLHCERCQFVIPANDARSEGWAVLPEVGEAYCTFCAVEVSSETGAAVPLSCTSIPQEKSRVDLIGRLELRWVILLTQILTLAAIGLNWQFFTLLLASASTVMVTVKQFARGKELKELLAKKKVRK